MPKQVTNKTGDAPIKHQGHTTNNNFGSGINPKAKWADGAAHVSIK